MRHGHGIKIYKNTDKYDGEWAYDLRQGKGTFTWANGDIYLGYWSKN